MTRYIDIPTTARPAAIEALLADDNSWWDVAAALGYRDASAAREDYANLRRRQSRAWQGMPVHPGDVEARCQRMSELRAAGVKWKDVVAEVGYSSVKSAQRAFQVWKQRGVRRERLPSGGFHRRCVQMDEMLNAGASWADIAVALGYASGETARKAYNKWRS